MFYVLYSTLLKLHLKRAIDVAVGAFKDKWWIIFRAQLGNRNCYPDSQQEMREYIIKSKEPVLAEPSRIACVEIWGLLTSEDCSEMSMTECEETKMQTEDETFKELSEMTNSEAVLVRPAAGLTEQHSTKLDLH